MGKAASALVFEVLTASPDNDGYSPRVRARCGQTGAVEAGPVIPTGVPTGPLAGMEQLTQGITRKTTLLLSVPLGVVTSTLPVIASAGTIAFISELETTVNFASLLSKRTLVARVRSVPEDSDGRRHLARGGPCFNKWAKTRGETENRATAEWIYAAAGPALVRYSV